MSGDRFAWNLYWASFAVLVLVLVAFLLARGAGIMWAIAVALPLLAGGANLFLRADAHERVCAIEVSRHRWLRLLTMGGYSRRAFLATGVLEIVAALVLGAWIAAR